MANRGEQISGERRRRNTLGLGGHRQRLAVNEAALDHENFVYRFVNDDGNRLHQLTVQDDYEVVQDRDNLIRTDGAGTGAEVAVPVGETSKGPLRAVLVRKPRKYYDEDAKAKAARIDEVEVAIKRGAAGGPTENAYVPRNGITMTVEK